MKKVHIHNLYADDRAKLRESLGPTVVLIGHGYLHYAAPLNFPQDGETGSLGLSLDNCSSLDMFRSLVQYNLGACPKGSRGYTYTLDMVKKYLESEEINTAIEELYTTMAGGKNTKTIAVAKTNLDWIEQMRVTIKEEESNHE